MLGSIAMSLSEMYPEQIMAIKGFITLFMVLPIPLIIVFIFSAFLFVEEDSSLIIGDANKNNTQKQIPYEERYPLSKVDKNNESKNEKNDTETTNTEKKDDSEKWKDKMKSYLNEYTPNGNVIMRYNYETEAFDFWCDDKNIKYSYLETVARKYVSIFNCRELYIDRSENIEKQMKDIKLKEINDKQKEEQKKSKENQENNDEKQEDNDDDLFVKLKTPLEKNKEKHKSKMELRNRRSGNKSTNEEITKKSLAPTEANKYIRKGDVKEADLYKKKEKVVHKNISFGMFKSMFGSRGSTSPMT